MTGPGDPPPGPVSDPRRVGALVRALRHLAGLGQAELAERCGYSASQISRWETSRSPLRDTQVVRKLAAALEVPPSAFGVVDVDPVWLTFAPLVAFEAAPRPPAARRLGDPPPRRRWTLRARDLQHRVTYLVVAVHPPSGTVTVHTRGPVVLDPADVRRLQQYLADALACVLADGGDW